MRIEQEHGYYTADLDGKFHSENDEPAIVINDYTEKNDDEEITVEGYMAWYTNGILHRENDLPAVIRNGGKKFWYENGNYIREE